MFSPIYTISEIDKEIGQNRQLPQPEAVIQTIAIDSRSVVAPENTLFVALRTSTADGHDFIPELYAQGVRNFLVSRLPEENKCRDGNFIVVDDTLRALQQLAAKRAQKAGSCPIIAVTGSRGKTITKELIYMAMKAGGLQVWRSPRSYNSQIGVPLSLLMMPEEGDFRIVEAGVSQPGEMEILADILRPEIGVITCITPEHSENFSSKAEAIAEKLKLFATAQTIYYNANDRDIAAAVEATYPERDLRPVDAPYPTDNTTNVALAEAVTGGQLPESLRRFVPSTRLDVIEGVNNCKLILNRFTPDMSSLRLAADFMHRRAPRQLSRTLVVAIDDLEASALAELLREYDFKRLITIGRQENKDLLRESIVRGIVHQHFTDEEEMSKRLAATDFAGEIILMQGSLNITLERLYAMIEAKQHETVLEVNLDAVVNNYNFFKSKIKPTTGIICMLKAAGYGAGSVELARTLQAHGAAYIAVAVVDEGVELRQAGISMPVMVLNPRAQNHKMMFDYRLEPEVYSFGMLEEIIDAAERYGISGFPIHIKLETGMRRLGFLPEEIPALAKRLKSTDRVVASTVFSHLACADDPADDDYTRQQFSIFNAACDELDSMLECKVKRHILNSTGIVRFPEQQHSFVRLGIGLYGIPTLNDGSMKGLRPVSTLSTVIISIKEWPAGTSIGYNRRTRLKQNSVIATVPIGYADGLDRHLGNGAGSMLVRGRRAPIVGNVCMDITMIDVTDIVRDGVTVNVGDRVELFGEQVGVAEMSSTLGTIPYEILTSISPRVKRVYYRE